MGKNNRSTFSITGHYLGALKGKILVAGQEVDIPQSATIYVVGQGIQENGYYVSNELMFVSGVRKQGYSVATLIVVRPASSAKTSHRKTRSSTSLVVEIAEDVPE